MALLEQSSEREGEGGEEEERQDEDCPTKEQFQIMALFE